MLSEHWYMAFGEEQHAACPKHVNDKVVKASMSKMLNLGHVRQFVIDSLNDSPLSKQ